MNKISEQRGGIQSVQRAIAIMRLLSETESLSLAQISEALAISKGTLHGLIKTLQNEGFVQQDAVTQRYGMGAEAYRIGVSFATHMDPRKIAEPRVKALSQELNETVHWGTLSIGYAVIVLKAERNKSFSLLPQTGTTVPLHCTAIGKALLSGLDDSEVKPLIALRGLLPYTEYTITDESRLFKELTEIRQRGYSLDNQEALMGLSCVGAPIFDYTSRVVGAISASTSTDSINIPGRREFVIQRVIATAQLISQSMGFLPGSRIPLVGQATKGLVIP